MYLNSIGKYEDRIRNLYFLYAVVLRAVNRAEHILNAYDYETHLNQEEDNKTPELLQSLLKISMSSCEEPFKENSLFRLVDNDFRQELLFKELQIKFYNISKILDCVSCEKCRLNGKLQVKGLGTAIKLLFSTNQNT